MRKNLFFSFVLFLFLLVPASIIWAQTITSEKGLTTAEFRLPQGVIKVFLPDDIRQGDVISGTVRVTAEGRNARQQEKNLEELLRSSVNIFSESIQVDNTVKVFRIAIPLSAQIQKTIELKNPVSGNPMSGNIPEQVFSQNSLSPDRCVIPSHVLTGSVMKIQGPFDGDASNTVCNIEAAKIEVLAESPRNCIVEWPLEATGQKNCTVREANGISCAEKVSGVDMIVTTGKLNLRRGENTYIDVKLTGLENLPDKTTLTIVNMTPNIVTMVNGNTQVIPVWPPPDSAKGNFSIHFPATSISTGNFTVNINLDLPEKGQAISNEEEIPPGYIKKSCTCSVSASVTKLGNAFSVTADAACTGAYGIGIQTFCRCSVLSTTYQWSIASGADKVSIVGSNNNSRISIRPAADAKYVICVIVTVTCIDGTTCVTTICVDETGRQVDHPGTETRPPTRPPTQPENPPTTERPPTTTRSKCKCECSVTITANGIAGKNYRYSANAVTACTGTSGTGSSRVVCGVASTAYSWSIVGGAADARINGAANAAGVNIERDEVKPLVLRVVVTVTCNDGTTCECSAEIEIPGLESKTCSPVVRERMEPAMDGGLVSRQIGIANNAQLPRDEFIVLQAEGGDWDQLVFRCEPSKPDCPDDPSEKTLPLVGKVRFEWVIEGEGSFVQLGCLPDEKMATGERVIFKPWYVPLPVKASDTTLTTTVILRIIDDGSAVIDETKEKRITIRLKRSKSNPDKYQVEISGGTGRIPSAPAKREDLKTCRTVGPTWTAGDDLAVPVIRRPEVPDHDKMVLGQWLLLSTDIQGDQDKAVFRCTSQAECVTGSREKNYADKIEYTWEIVRGGGRFITGNLGRVVVYEAPTESRNEVTEVFIRVTVKNPPGERNDPEKKQQEMVIRFYKPGIRISHPELTWLPTDTNSVELSSTLLYKDGDWKPGLAHMCRIQFFELMKVSAEKGICLNDPVPKDANDCRDLLLKQEEGHEAFDDPKATGKCTVKEMFIQARTNLPEREYRIRVHSRDFGSYGFLRSFGNINKKTRIEGKPVYVSVPVQQSDVPHPMGFRKKTIYPDNTVSIPRDADENRIADGGWEIFGGGRIADVASNNADEDDEPVGDGFRGDGLTTYEEYRGFRVRDADVIVHQRTNYLRKDIFIRNRDRLNLNLYTRVSALDVHEIDSHHYVSDRSRVVNANFNRETHVADQMGLFLKDGGHHSSLLGVAVSRTMEPSIPNLEVEIIVYTQKISESCRSRNMGDSIAKKTAAVTAHELLHGNNVCHHGEGNPALERSADARNGLRSGNMNCVMRYDNTGTAIRGFTPEAVGSDLCTDPAGTGYNAGGNGFGNAAVGRGNCRGLIRISGRVNPPKPCRQR